jgi:hypothetical protein
VTALPAFQLRVYARGDCFESRRATHSRGYGTFIHGGQRWQAHRFAYVTAKGPIPQWYDVHHTCRHHWCVRPSHLVALPNWEHGRLSPLSLVRIAATVCAHGHPLDREHLTGARYCGTCRRAHDRAAYARRKVA